jgi:hypothetical protein
MASMPIIRWTLADAAQRMSLAVAVLIAQAFARNLRCGSGRLRRHLARDQRRDGQQTLKRQRGFA